ncbi:GNAT family N-acetyltransferase [Dyella psychrodurans]|uniref:GNAT family N-acetyltransferase n=1 Tax=Dyella psychrodurans TaxID=1927960 RepID=A0A370XB95_9GAMM|nr:GNAT family N-acetyltransferase [Dyella psychrodurans]RDS85531.1 GNAT family N-acetyltransferase [Dyella psychrodurans]
MSFQIRQATVHDLDVLVPLFDGYRQFYMQPSDPALARAFLSERFAHHQSLMLIACDDQGNGLGFTQLYPLFSSVRAVRIYLLNDLFVAPDARRRGVASALLEASAEHARALGAASLLLSTAIDNAPAQALYESLGWRRDPGFCEYRLVL